jgi:hypothetical protein
VLLHTLTSIHTSIHILGINIIELLPKFIGEVMFKLLILSDATSPDIAKVLLVRGGLASQILVGCFKGPQKKMLIKKKG